MVTTPTTRTPRYLTLQEVHTRYAHANQARAHLLTRLWVRTPGGGRIWAAVADIPALCHEVLFLRTLVVHLRMDRADLTAAARAAILADSEGDKDPLWYLRDELTARGQLPTAQEREASW